MLNEVTYKIHTCHRKYFEKGQIHMLNEVTYNYCKYNYCNKDYCMYLICHYIENVYLSLFKVFSDSMIILPQAERGVTVWVKIKVRTLGLWLRLGSDLPISSWKNYPSSDVNLSGCGFTTAHIFIILGIS